VRRSSVKSVSSREAAELAASAATVPPRPLHQSVGRGNPSSIVMVALRNRADHYIFMLWFLSSIYLSLFSSPNLSGRRLDVCHTSTHGVALVRV